MANQPDLKQFWAERDRSPRGRWDMELPEWVQTRTHYLRLLLAVLLAAIAISSLAGCSAGASDNWRPVSSILDEAQVEMVVDENTADLSESEREALINSTQSLQLDDDLVAVLFDSELLTGALGTRFALYQLSEDSPQQVLQTYVNPNLPDGFQLVEVTETDSNGLPCLWVHQLATPPGAPEVNRLELCFNGTEYELVNESTIEFEQEES